jgi:hypothetical protein
MVSSGARATQLFAALPQSLRDELVACFDEISRNYRESRWEPAELNGGKLCEVVYTILRGYVDGTFPPRAAKPANMVDACRALEQAGQHWPRSVRVQIPRMLVALYEIRNNRGVGHVGGDVDPNRMDATVVLSMAQWLMAELVRLFHGVDTSTAQVAVDALVTRTVPVVWEVDGRKRVLAKGVPYRSATLLLLYSCAGPVSDADLRLWVEHPDMSGYRRDVLRRLHRDRLAEYDETAGNIRLSPVGVAYVETALLPSSSTTVKRTSARRQRRR